MSAITSLIKGGAWLTLANVVSKLASMLVLPLLARLLGPESLGIYSIVFSLAQSAQGFTSLGADIAMHRNGAQYKTLGTEAVGRLFGVGFSLICLVSAVTGLAVWLFRESLAQHWLGQPNVTLWLGAAAILIVTQPFSNIPLLFLASLQDFRAYALRSSIEMIFTGLLTVILAWQWGLGGSILGLVIAEIIQIPWSYCVAKPVLQVRGIRLRFDKFWTETISIFRFGFPYYFGNTLLGSLIGLPLMGLVSQYGGLQELGYLRVAQSMAALIGFIPSAIAPAAISYLSASYVGDSQSYQALKSIHLRGIWILLLLPTGAVCLLLPNIINLLFGDAYQQATILAWLSLWTSALAGITAVLVQSLLVAGKTVRVAFASLLGAILGVSVTLILVPEYKGIGFLIGQLSGQMGGLLSTFYPVISDFDSRNLSLLKWLFSISILVFCLSSIPFIFIVSTEIRYFLCIFITFACSILLFNTSLHSDEKKYLLKVVNTLKPTNLS